MKIRKSTYIHDRAAVYTAVSGVGSKYALCIILL